ncbi:Ribonuclease H-like domain [Cinara cedri]|uniref:Ribonuclease H-like domain n=1 Tax=Cinara cedri TaxID=506608 RepID=A0A5E4NR14_9HEMI|nr:Ribonuclease H-like domain [Cinara cedri]
MNIYMCKYNPLRGASYIKLPKIISDKKAIINIKNKDNKCFLWSALVLAALHPQHKHAYRVSKYKEWENEFNEKSLTDHEEYCKTNKCAKSILPNISDRIPQFEKYNHYYKVPFVIYADFESMLPKIDKCQPCDTTSYTKKYQKHLPVSLCFNVNDLPPILVKRNRIFNETIDYCQSKIKGGSIVENKNEKERLDLENIEKEIEYFKKQLDEKQKEKPMFIEDHEDNMEKIRDHDHLTGKYRGAAHSICNLN